MRPLNFLLAGIAVLLGEPVPAQPVSADQPQTHASSEESAGRPLSDKYTPGNVIVSFEGGDVATDIGKVILALVQDGGVIPTTHHLVAENEDPCRIVLALSYPACSADLMKALDVLNPKLLPSRGHLSIGDAMIVPDVWLRKYRTFQKFARSVQTEQSRSATIKKGWTSLGIGSANVGPNTELVSFNAYELILFAGNPEIQAKLEKRLYPFKTLNVRVNSIPFVAAATTTFSYRDPSQYQTECGSQPQRPSAVNYRVDYLDSDADAAALVAQRPPGSRATRVYVIDFAVDPTPNLSGAVEGQPVPLPAGGWRCTWVNPAQRDHATHLASIIASRDNGYGFVGVSPTSTIKPFELIRVNPNTATGLGIIPGKELELADRIVAESSSSIPHVYLVATRFSDFDSDWVTEGQLDLTRRFERGLEHNISQARPMLVVSAGQADVPIPLSPGVPMSPQNMGDQRYVLVVTACENCTRAAPRLWSKANYSAPDGHYVHVAAPGGMPMLGWVNAQGISAFNGTSQAAAFAAGEVAEMIGRWPDSYSSVEYAKKRIQTTSWPIYQGNGTNDYTRVATGIIDPNLALLDPTKTWIKTSTEWKPILLRGFSTDVVRFRKSSGAALPMSTESVARIVRVTRAGAPAQYVVYKDMYADNHEPEKLGEIGREGPLTLAQPINLQTCDGQSWALSDLADVIIANRQIEDPPCA